MSKQLCLPVDVALQVEHPAAPRTDQVRMRRDHRVKAVAADAGMDPPELPHLLEEVEVAVDGAEADVRKPLLDHLVDFFCVRMLMRGFHRVIHEHPLT